MKRYKKPIGVLLMLLGIGLITSSPLIFESVGVIPFPLALSMSIAVAYPAVMLIAVGTKLIQD